MGKRNPNTNHYRSGKNPHRQVLVSELPEGGYAVTVLDTKNAKLVHFVVGEPPQNGENLTKK